MGDNQNVIDNEKIKLVDQLKKTLPNTKKASIAVGYFFISGFAQIMDSFGRIESSTDENDIIRLLISPTTDRQTAEALLAGNESYDTVREGRMRDLNSAEEADRARGEMRRAMEYMPQTDGDYSAAVKLRDLMRRGKLHVKVYTREQLHAKAYIFELESGELDAMAVVGSSNLSVAGISEHTELNLRTYHTEDSKALLDWFDDHWNDDHCVEFTADLADIIDRSWIARHKPSDVYHKALLHEHEEKFDLCVIKDPPTGSSVKKLFDFQRVAVAQAIKKLDAFGGVMISDVVGTGKTLIGTAILRHLVDEHRSNPLVICPPHLIGMWEQYLRDYMISGAVLSRHKIGLDPNLLSRHSNHDVILIDESHNFRSKTTRSYRELKAFMDEKTDEARIIMLSATPISNKLTDLKNQLALFPAEMLSKIDVLGRTSLDEYFKGTTNDDGTVTDEGRKRIQELLRHILIRRTRTQIKEKYATYDDSKNLYYLEAGGEKAYFPKRVLKHPKEYDIERVYNNAFASVVETLENLKLAKYNPGEYIREEYLDESHPEFQKYDDLRSSSLPLVGIVRTSMLKRVESSIKAFSDSVNNYYDAHRRFRVELEKGIVPIGKEFHDVMYHAVADSNYDDESYESDISEIQSDYSTDAFEIGRWIADIKDDSDQFAKMRGHLGSEGTFTQHDDKLDILVDILGSMADDKILIFSESASTARYIAGHLKKEAIQKKIGHRTVEQIDSKSDVSKSGVIYRFDPHNNPRPAGRTSSLDREIDILISTDVLSEGVNLQSARIVINYDFHWNPVRLIQRVGRIDRIGTRHERIDVLNFLPTTKGEAELGLREKVANKIKLIKSIVGHDSKILEDTEIFDENSITDIYASGGDIIDMENVGILDIADSRADKDSDRLKDDVDLLPSVQALPFGMRCASGHGRLLIACEADERIERNDGKLVVAKKFRRHYVVARGGGRQPPSGRHSFSRYSVTTPVRA